MKKITLLLVLLCRLSYGQTPVHRFNFENNLQNSTNTLTLAGARLSYVAGRNVAAGQALFIDNDGTVAGASYLDSVINGITPTGSFSVSFWAKMISPNTATEYRLLSLGVNTGGSGTPSNGFTLRQRFLNGTEYLQVVLGSGTNRTTELEVPSNTIGAGISIGWHLYTLVHDSQASHLKLYKNGVLLTSNTTSPYSFNFTDLTLRAARYTDRVNDPFPSGRFEIDDLQIFNSALTDAQVLALSASAPAISAVSATSLTTTGATINYSINPNGAATTPVVRYGLTSTNLNLSQACAVVVAGTTAVTQTQAITGLTPNTTYFYRVEASNSVGSATPSSTTSFTTLPTNQQLYHFPFNGNVLDQPNNVQFTVAGAPASYSNNDTALIGGGNKRLTASLPNLPQGNAARSVSIRVFFNSGQLASSSKFLVWGTGTANQAYGFSFNPAETQAWTNYFWGATDVNFSMTAFNFGTWQNFVLTHDGTQVKVYQNGNLVMTSNRTLNTTGTTLTMGTIPLGATNELNCDVDDLRFYNYALSQTEVSALNTSLSTADFNVNNLKFNLYPNPATNLVNIELATELKSIEIYSLQGQKVLTSNKKQVDVSTLSKGMYMIRVEDVENGVSTQKLIIE